MSSIGSVSNSKVLFEPLQPNDFSTLRSLADRIWKLHYPGIISMDQILFMLDKNFSNERIHLELSQGFVYELIRLNDNAIGYCAFRFETENRRVFLSKLYVLPEFHGKGIGQEALSHIIRFANMNNASSIYLFVNKKNDKAIKAYERFGFIKSREVVTDIGNGFVMDDFEMTLLI